MAAFDSTVPVWPIALAPADVAPPILVKPVIEGPQPLAGTPQAVVGSTGFWQMQLIEIPVWASLSGTDRIGLWRQFYSGYAAQGVAIYMRAFDWNRGPRARAAQPLYGPTTGPTTGTPYAQGTGDCTVALPALARSTTLSAAVASVSVPAAGDFFSIGDRLYQIVTSTPDPIVSGRYNWTIVPGLRADANVSDLIEIADPICRMILSPKDRGMAVRMTHGRFGNPTLTFNEANWTA